MRERILQPTDKTRASLQESINAARDLKRQEAVWEREEADRKHHLQQVERAATIAISGATQRKIWDRVIDRTSNWVDLPRISGADGTIQVRLIRTDYFSRRILGIPFGSQFECAEADLRIAAPVDDATSDIQSALFFGKPEPDEQKGVYVPSGLDENPTGNKWRLVEVGGHDWQEVERLLSFLEEELPKLTEFVS